MARQIRREEVESNPIFAELVQKTSSGARHGATTVYRRSSKASRSSTLRRRTCSCSSKAETCRHQVEDGEKAKRRGRLSNDLRVQNGSNGRANSVQLMEGIRGDSSEREESRLSLFWRIRNGLDR